MQRTILFLLFLLTAAGSATGHDHIDHALPQKSIFNFPDPGNGDVPGKIAQQILGYINEMREDPAAFYQKYLEDYISRQGAHFSSYYTSSLKKDMHGTGKLLPFTLSATMIKTASYQATYLKGLGGHTLTHDAGSLSFEQRMHDAGVGCAGENLYTGENRTALQVVMDLLIDEGVSSFGHRKNLLSTTYKSIGIAVVNYSRDGYIVVMDFSCN